MGLTSAMNNAMSGLNAAARQAQVASSNIANAMTDGYRPRTVGLSAATLGGVGSGVRVTGVQRQTDPVLAALTRDAGAAAASGTVSSAFWSRLEGAIGLPDAPGSLSARVSAMEGALISATARPDLEDRLAAVGSSARELASTLNRLESGLQAQRLDADATIAREVADLGAGLTRVAELNTTIRKLELSGQSPLGLMDERDRIVQSLSEIVPLRVLPRPDGQIRLYSDGGLLLLDGPAPALGFAAAPGMAADMTLENGMLSGLQVAGHPVDTGPNGPLSGGRLGALFALRDRDAPAAQASLDRFAADLIARFQDPAADPTRAPGDPGLFTDAGTPLSGPPAPGLAGRLAVNTVIDPAAGGALWHLRSGLGAGAAGPSGDSAQLHRFLAAMDQPRAPAPGVPATGLSGGAGALLANISQTRQSAEDHAVYARSRLDQLTDEVRARGVDTDAELQRLILIEQAHAANARVIQVVDDMLRRLMEI